MSQQPSFFQKVPSTAKPNALADEKARTDSNKAKVLAHLKAFHSATNVELAAIGGMRFGARVHELQKDGYNIIVSRVKAGLFRITLED